MSSGLESRVADWVRTRIGETHMHPRERAMRLLEEAAELAQAEGVTSEQANQQIAYVFSRSAFLYARGFPRTEWRARFDEALRGMEHI